MQLKDIEQTKEISAQNIKDNLRTKILGSEIKVFETISSTSTYLKENTCENGEVIVALHQSAGRGRKGRSFLSNSNKGIYFSFILNANINFDKLPLITIWVAVAVARSLKSVYNIEVSIKWVNDLFFNNKKLGGILTESVLLSKQQKVEKLIIGIGLNTEKVADEISDIATSIEEITKNSNQDNTQLKNNLISEILNNFEEIYLSCLESSKSEEKIKSLITEYKSKLFFLNKEITVVGQEVFTAKAVDLNEKGELIVENSKGELITLNSGEISIKVTK